MKNKKQLDALNILDRATAVFQGNRQEHAIIQQALITLREFLGTKEKKNGNKRKSTTPKRPK